MAGEAQTISGYIVHHLTNLTYGKLPAGFHRHDGSTVPDGGMWTLAHGGEEAAAMGFSAIHIDSMIWSIGLGILFCWLFRSHRQESQFRCSERYGQLPWR
jgi:F-type H+-transporting ATPase subunit a